MRKNIAIYKISSFLPSVSNMTIQESGLSELNDLEKIEIKWIRVPKNEETGKKLRPYRPSSKLAKSQLADKHY